MNIKKLSDLTGLNAESIRMIRNQGFLNPEQKPNGYYDYKIEDMISLLYFRKLRELHYPTAKIQGVYETDSLRKIQEVMEEQEAQLQLELRNIQLKLADLKIAQNHLDAAIHSEGCESWLFDIPREKIDLLDPHALSMCRDHFSLFTPSLHVSMDDLNSPEEDRIIPMQACVGIFLQDLKNLGLSVPQTAVHIPNGTNLFQVLQLSSFSDFHLSQLSPLRTYAKTHGLIFTSDLTGGLLNVHKDKDGFHYIFTVRACVRPADESC